MSEEERIQFIEQRDGPEAALKFAEQGLAIYTEAAIRESKYRDSIKFYQKYISERVAIK